MNWIEPVGYVILFGIMAFILIVQLKFSISLFCHVCKRSVMIVAKKEEANKEGHIKVATEQGWLVENYRMYPKLKKDGYKATCPHCRGR